MHQWFEVNFDGLVGPTYTFSGLSYGNIASLKHKDEPASPREAAHQALDKMHFLSRLGIKQAVLPPHERPHMPTLKRLGYTGSDAGILAEAEEPLLVSCSSASSMWAANSVTTAPSLDAMDGKAHITPANLSRNFHRSLEASQTRRVMEVIFSNADLFSVHTPLPGEYPFSDEGAANHTRFCQSFDETGFHLFVYGRTAWRADKALPKKYPSRQTLEGSRAVARLNRLNPDLTMFVQQSPEAIDAGVFHNDVISTGNQDFFLYHEKAFVDTDKAVSKLKEKIMNIMGWELKTVKIPDKELSLKDAVGSYLFNSQIVTKDDGSMIVIAPEECRGVAQDLLPGMEIVFADLKQSMRNGGGPACLRARFVLSQKEVESIKPNVFLNDELYLKLKDWIDRHYRDRLMPSDLADPDLLKESREALNELSGLLKLGTIYDFQR